MDFRNNNNKKSASSSSHQRNNNAQKTNSRFNVTPLGTQEQMNQLLLQQYFLQQEQQQQQGQQGMAAAQAAAAALFGGILGDKLSGGGREQLSELFAAAAAAQQSSPAANRSQSSTPSPRISSPHHQSTSRPSSSSSSQIKKPSDTAHQQAAAALAAQQQWVYLDYLQRMQQEAAAQQQQQQQTAKRGRSNSRGNSSSPATVQAPRKPPGRPPNTQKQRDLTKLLEQYNTNNSLLKSSVLASAKLPADTEIIVQKNNRVQKPLPNKRGPKPKNQTITSEQAKFEQQLINLGNNNAITITPANLEKNNGATQFNSNQAPITITPAPSNSQQQPPPAHSTPFRYGNDKRELKPETSKPAAQPAHKYVKELYTHVIPRKPQIGLIGANRKVMVNKKPVRHHRPWMEHAANEIMIVPAATTTTPPPLNLNKEKKLLNIPKHHHQPEPIIISPPDYSLPIREGWRREMLLKAFDLNENTINLACDVNYINTEGKVYSSLNEIKKSNVPEPKNFTFNSKIQLGKFVLPASESNTKRFDYDELVEYFNHRKVEEQERKKNLRMKHEHNNYVKGLETYRKNKRKLKLNEKKHADATPKSTEIEELLDDLDNSLPVLPKIEGKRLNDKTFANLLQIHEFLHTFGETLGFDLESLPSLGSLQKAFLHVEDNEEELVSVLCHLLVCAVEDPGLPNPTGTKHLTPFGQTLKQADVTFGSMSEILRIYLNGISDSEPEAEDYAEWLEHAPFTAQSAYRKSVIVAFICDVLLQNKAVLKFLDNCSELIHNCKKEKQQNEIRIRKLRMLVARKQVACVDGDIDDESNKEQEKEDKESEKIDESLVSAGEDSMMQGDDDKSVSKDPAYAAVASVADSISSDPDSKLTIEELNSKIQTLGSSSEKLKKQMQINNKSIRSVCMGQDRWRRRYWNLHFGGGIYIEGGATGEFEEVRKAVKEKFDQSPVTPEEPEVKEEEDSKEPKRSTPFTVPPPVIKIFSFAPRTGCSGAVPEDQNRDRKLTDDELLVKHVRRTTWYDWKCVRNQQEIDCLVAKLCDKGLRERHLKSQLASCNYNEIPELNSEDTENVACNREDDGFVDPELLYKIHLGLIETLETLEERVASASLQVKGWALPSRNLIQENLSEEKIIEIVKERVLDLEGAVERRYLKPPLGKSGLEVNLTQLLKESEDSYNLLLDGPIGSTSSTRGQQINENNKLKMELKEKERLEKELALRKEKEEGGGGKGERWGRFLNHWRDAISKTTSPSVLSMAIYILDSSIAWDKSVMKASCQLCKGGDNEDKLLLCDACDRGYHTYCFKPPLDNIPDGDWFCWECINKATGNKCCIVCGKGQIPNIKLLCCDKCVKAYHQDCIHPPVSKAPRGRWFCPDHREGTESKNYRVTLSHAVNVSMVSASEKEEAPSKNAGGVVVVVKKASPKKKKERVAAVDGNVSDSSNSCSFEKTNTRPVTPPAPVQEEVTKEKNNKKKKSVEEPKMSKKTKSEMSWCEKILDDLVGHEDAWPFLEPVNTRQFPTYKKIIKTPMDLQTIKTRLVANHYKNKEAFLQDVRLIFDNCETFNEDDSPVGKAGHSLRVFFEGKPGVGTGNNSSSGGNGGGK